jgi:hypothetical protein
VHLGLDLVEAAFRSRLVLGGEGRGVELPDEPDEVIGLRPQRQVMPLVGEDRVHQAPDARLRHEEAGRHEEQLDGQRFAEEHGPDDQRHAHGRHQQIEYPTKLPHLDLPGG